MSTTAFRMLALFAVLAATGCSRAPVTADERPPEPRDQMAALDHDDVQVRFEAVERLEGQLQSPVMSADLPDGCYTLEAPPALECSSTVDFCKEHSGRYSHTSYEVAWAYPAAPPEIFGRGGYYLSGGRMGPPAGVIPGGIPLLEKFTPFHEPRLDCPPSRSSINLLPTPGRAVGSPTFADESAEQAERRRAEMERRRREAATATAAVEVRNARSIARQKMQIARQQACIERIEASRQSVTCEVVFFNPCRREAFMRCEGGEPGAGQLDQIDLPRGELLRVTWGKGSKEKSAIFTVDIETREEAVSSSP
ncbi:MAG: hypothetical protein ACLFVJ_18820 [Persicimonas sp.]